MRALLRCNIVRAAALALSAPLFASAAGATGVAVAQGAAPAHGPAQAPAQVPADEPQPKQVKLSQKTIDQLIATQKQIRDAESKQKVIDPKSAEAKVETVAKANGFASMSDFADASYSVGLVLAGTDPDSGAYVGPQAALKKQIDEVKADKKMPPNEKKEALDELNDAMKSATTEKPLPGNIDLVKANAEKLNEGAQSPD